MSPLIKGNTYVPCTPSHGVPGLAAPRPENVSNSSLQTATASCLLQLNQEPVTRPLDGTSAGGRGGGGGDGGGGVEGMPQVEESAYPPQTSEYRPKTPTYSRVYAVEGQGALQVLSTDGWPESI